MCCFWLQGGGGETAAGAGGGGYAKFVAMAGRQYGRAAFTRASVGWLGRLKPAEYYLHAAAAEVAEAAAADVPSGPQRQYRKQGRKVEAADDEAQGVLPGAAGGTSKHGLPPTVEVLRWGRPGVCAEAALREEVVEVSSTLVQWMEGFLQQQRRRKREPDQLAAASADGGTGGGGRVVSLLRGLEEAGQELQTCQGELEIMAAKATRAETLLAAGGSADRKGPSDDGLRALANLELRSREAVAACTAARLAAAARTEELAT